MPTLRAKAPTPRTKKTPLAKLYGKDQDRYLELLNLFPLKPVRTEDELDAATVVIHMLIDQKTRSKAEEDYLEVLTEQVRQYEEVHYPDPPVTDGEMLAFWLDIKAVTQSKLAKDAGIAESTVSEVLAGKRKLTRTQVGKVCKYFNLSPALFDHDDKPEAKSK